jgi:glycosyltransferase involved in cell wall biosynthesis
MRILKVTQVYHPFLEKGGPAIKVKAIAEHLVRRGHQVTVLTTSYGKPQAPGTFVQGGVAVVYLRPLLTYRATTLDPGVLRFCRLRLREFDVVHIYGLYDLLGPLVARHCRARGIPYVIEPLGMTRAYDRSLRLKRIWHALFAGAYFRGATALIATSEQEYAELVADGFSPGQLFLRYNGLDLSDFRELPARDVFRRKRSLPPDEPLVLFLGRLIPRKGADLLIAAFAEACPLRGRLVIAGPEGEAGYLKSLRKEARSRQVQERVLFAGPLYAEEKKEALAAADVFVLPSRYENFANAAAEAIACSTPVIVTGTCGISRLVEGRVGLVIERRLETLVLALRELLGDPGLQQRFRSACPAVAASLSWERLVEPLEGLYRQSVQRGVPQH